MADDNRSLTTPPTKIYSVDEMLNPDDIFKGSPDQGIYLSNNMEGKAPMYDQALKQGD